MKNQSVSYYENWSLNSAQINEGVFFMSGQGFHVHGPHDHELEHAAKTHNGEGGFAGQLAVITAVLATAGALFAHMSGSTQSSAGMYKNDAAMKKTAAANQWGAYQAKSIKQNFSEFSALSLPLEQRTKYQDEVLRYNEEKNKIRQVAEALEKESDAFDAQSAAQMHQHHRWSQATTALQISIAMAAIALLTKRKWLEYFVFLLGGLGLVLGALAWFHI
jgi:hypothetical protein